MAEQTPTEKRTSLNIREQQERDIARWLDYLKVTCNKIARDHGFWDKDEGLTHGTEDVVFEYVVAMKLMLIVTEAAEALEGIRKGGGMDEHCPDFTSLEVEMADIIIRVADLSGQLSLRLGEAVVAKMAFNKDRPHMHNKRF